MESLTYQRNLKSTPKKMRMIRDLIVSMSPSEALSYLMYTPTKSAKLYYKSIKSAINNATSALKVGADMLKFKLLIVEEGRTLKRFKAGSKGMAKPIAKRFSHLKIVLVESNVKPKVKNHIAEKKEKVSNSEIISEDQKVSDSEKPEVKKKTVKKAPVAKKEVIKKSKSSK